MKQKLVWAATSIVLAGCGGGGGDSSPAAPVAVTPTVPVAPPPAAVTPPPPPPAPTPVVTLASGNISRQVAADTGIAMDVTIKPNFTPTGALYASVADNAGLLTPAVTVVPNSDGSYTLSLSTVSSVPAGVHTGEFTIKLCSDAACATPQAVPSIKVPYSITATTANSAWPGDAVTPLTPWTDVPEWTTFQGNAAHTGNVPVTLNPDKFSLRWKNGSVNPQNGAPVTLAAANGLFYVPKDKKLEARKEVDGSLVWSYDLSTLEYPSVNPAAVANGIVYMAAGQYSSAYMFGLDASTGAVVLKAPMSSQWGQYMAPVVYDGAIYANGGMYGGLYAIKSTGDVMFNAYGPQTDKWSPAVDANSVYVFLQNALTVYDRKTGVQRNQITDTNATSYGYQGSGSPVLTSPGTVIAADYAGVNWGGSTNALLKFNVDKGYIDWRVPGGYGVTPAYANGVIYAPNKSPYRLEARAESDATLRWSWIPPVAGETNWSAEPIVTNNLVFVSTNKNTYAVDLHSGKTVWSYPLAGRLVLTRSGILYIHAVEALVAINVK